MTIYVYPADTSGCGHYRLIWPAQVVQKLGLPVKIISPSERNPATSLSGEVRHDKLIKVHYPEDATLIVLQRPTHRILHQAVKLLREDEGVPVVIDMDDDLSCIHPANPAFMAMHPKNLDSGHNWRFAEIACKNASLVTTSTDALMRSYAPPGRGRVLWNCVPERFMNLPVPERTHFGWAGSLGSHPDDLDPLGTSIAQLARVGHRFKVISNGNGVAEKLGLNEVEETGNVPMAQWPNVVNQLKVGIAPLADTKFNKAKSWLKPLEYSALGIPWVASPRAEYVRLASQSHGGILAKKPGEWGKAIEHLMTDESYYKEQSQAVKEMAKMFTYERRAHLWAEAWMETIKTHP